MGQAAGAQGAARPAVCLQQITNALPTDSDTYEQGLRASQTWIPVLRQLLK